MKKMILYGALFTALSMQAAQEAFQALQSEVLPKTSYLFPGVSFKHAVDTLLAREVVAEVANPSTAFKELVSAKLHSLCDVLLESTQVQKNPQKMAALERLHIAFEKEGLLLDNLASAQSQLVRLNALIDWGTFNRFTIKNMRAPEVLAPFGECLRAYMIDRSHAVLGQFIALARIKLIEAKEEDDEKEAAQRAKAAVDAAEGQKALAELLQSLSVKME